MIAVQPGLFFDVYISILSGLLVRILRIQHVESEMLATRLWLLLPRYSRENIIVKAWGKLECIIRRDYYDCSLAIRCGPLADKNERRINSIAAPPLYN
jgi:hypothetical protein